MQDGRYLRYRVPGTRLLMYAVFFAVLFWGYLHLVVSVSMLFAALLTFAAAEIFFASWFSRHVFVRELRFAEGEMHCVTDTNTFVVKPSMVRRLTLGFAGPLLRFDQRQGLRGAVATAKPDALLAVSQRDFGLPPRLIYVGSDAPELADEALAAGFSVFDSLGGYLRQPDSHAGGAV